MHVIPPTVLNRRSPAAMALSLIVLVCLAIIGLTAWRILEARSLELRNSQTSLSNLARALSDHAHATMEVADPMLAEVVGRIEADGTAPDVLALLHRIMEERTSSTRIRDLFVFDAGGNLLATSLSEQPSGTALDREYFQWHRENEARGLHLGPPVKGRHNGRWSLTVSRRISATDGTFAGVAVATIDADLFDRFYASFNVGPNGAIALVAGDSTLLVRHPNIPAKIGLTNLPFMKEVMSRGPVGDRADASPVDGVMRYTSYRTVDDYPLVVFVNRSEDDVLASWRRDSAIVAATAAAVILALGVLGWRLSDQIMQRRCAEADMIRSEQRYRLLADTSTDLIIHSDPSHRRVYVSPASKGLLGYTPEELMALQPAETVHPDDASALRHHLEVVHGGSEPDAVNYRMRHKDGTYLWVEAIARNIGDGQGVVAAIRDITARKTAEDQLHAANNKLQQMAMQDGLTGIANRRNFNLAIRKEIRRCTRAERPLAALLIDVDHFKAFNDAYGHSVGDECLVSIAAALDGQMRRPADLVARYGGEEFIVLLPDAEREGALHCAEKLMAAVHSLAIPHGQGLNGMVTISIGVAVMWPCIDGETERALIDAADAALYEAKRAGRARVHLGQIVAELITRPETAPPDQLQPGAASTKVHDAVTVAVIS